MHCAVAVDWSEWTQQIDLLPATALHRHKSAGRQLHACRNDLNQLLSLTM